MVFGPLIGAVVAAAVFRETFAWAVTGRHGPRTVALGVALAAGLLVGQRLSLVSAVSDASVLLRLDPAPFHLVVAGAIALACVLFVRWIVAGARCWLPVATRLRSPRRASVPLALGAAAVAGIGVAVFEILVASRELIELLLPIDSADFGAVTQVVPAAGPEWLWRIVLGPEVRIVIDEPLVVGMFLLVALVPWAALPLWRRPEPAGTAAWGALDADAPPPLVPVPALRPRRALAVGVVAGGGIALALVALHLVLRASYDAPTRDRTEFLLALAYWVLSATLLGQLLAGAVAAAWSRDLAVLHGVLAGLVAGVIGTAASGIARALAPCLPATAVIEGRACGTPPTVDFMLLSAATALTVGLVGAALGAGAVIALRAVLQRSGQRVGRAAAPSG
jgi:hypothetical protein